VEELQESLRHQTLRSQGKGGATVPSPHSSNPPGQGIAYLFLSFSFSSIPSLLLGVGLVVLLFVHLPFLFFPPSPPPSLLFYYLSEEITSE
tara:strand:- start:98 stop:370 length:273 start_codon:yes stop_codon:yes gene_type:complete